MEVVKVVCPRCGKRLFDLSLERPPGWTVMIEDVRFFVSRR